MLRLYKLKVPAHKLGKSFRFDFPIAGNGNMLVGAFARIRGFESCFAKLSISTDGRIVVPSIKVMTKPWIRPSANNMLVPVDFERMGNKITFVVEEFVNPYILGTKGIVEQEYTIDVYIKSKEQ